MDGFLCVQPCPGFSPRASFCDPSEIASRNEKSVVYSATVTSEENGKASAVWGKGENAPNTLIAPIIPGPDGAWENPEAKVEIWRKKENKEKIKEKKQARVSNHDEDFPPD